MEPTLCAIVRDDGSGLLQARLLELDIAVASDSIDGIIEEIRHALIVEHMLAGEQGRGGKRPPMAEAIIQRTMRVRSEGVMYG